MAAKLESPANPPTGKRQSKTNDQIDSEMGKFIEAAAGPFTHGMTVEQLHAAITETNSQLLKAFDEFILGAREGGLVTPTRGENWKRQGNEAFKKKSYEQAILLYTRALHDLDDPAVISALLNNRATCLFHMELYPQCIADATASMHLTPTYLKAYYRRGNALQKIGVDEAVHDIEYSEAAPEGTEKGVYEKNAALCEKVEAILAGLPVGAQTEEIFLNKKLDLQYCWEKGRKLIANKSIEPGEVLITESAFAAGLRPEHLLTHCDFCLQHTPNLYTHRHLLSKKATFRSRGLYCSEACAQGAFDTYLELENKHPFFLVCPLDCLVAMRRVVRSRGDVKVKNAFVAAGQVKLDKDVRENPNNAALLKAATGTLVEHLEGFTHESEPTLSIGGNESAVACLAYHAGALAAVSLYSKGAKEGVDKLDASLATDGALESREALNAQPESDFVSIPELWEAADELKLAMRQIVTNGVGVSKLLQVGANAGSVENKTPVAAIMHSVEQTKVATALFPHVAMVNHSCQPNAFLNFVGAPATAHRTVHLRATKLISPGEDITISYGPHKNKIHSSKNRREALQNQYNFLCFCEACSTEVDEPVCTQTKWSSSSGGYTNTTKFSNKKNQKIQG